MYLFNDEIKNWNMGRIAYRTEHAIWLENHPLSIMINPLLMADGILAQAMNASSENKTK